MAIRKSLRRLCSALTAAAIISGAVALPSGFSADVSAASSSSNVYKGHTYKVFNNAKTWKEAEKYCEKQGGHLVTIGSSGEQRFVEGLIRYEEKTNYWIGLTQKSGKWKWVDGTKLSYTNYDDCFDGQFGKEYYACMFSRTRTYDEWQANEGMWDDARNDAGTDLDHPDVTLSDFGFICEWDSKKNVSESSKSKEKITVMLYFDGADLEPNFGEVTNKINQLIKGYDGSKNVNIIIQTGGTWKWKYKGITANKCQRWIVKKGKIKLIDDTLGKKNMAASNTLSDFIKYCRKNYKADRYALVMSDHGGGITGLCQDPTFNNDILSLDELNKALDEGNTYFDFIGTDACLMSNIETVLAVSDYTDYLVGSENVSYVPGWNYENWIRELCKDPSMKTEKICKIICDDYTDSMREKKYITDMSVINTKKTVKKVLPAFTDMASSVRSKLTASGFAEVARAKHSAEVVDGTDFYLVDIKQFCSQIGSKETEKLFSEVDKALVYTNKTVMGNSLRGMSMTLPSFQKDMFAVDTILSYYKKLGFDTAEYTSFIKHYANIVAGAVQYYYSNNARNIYKNCQWLNSSQFLSSDVYSRLMPSTYYTNIGYKVVNGEPRVPKSVVESSSIVESGIQVWLSASGGISKYLLGDINILWADNEGYLMNPNNSWVTINNMIVPAFFDGSERATDSYIDTYHTPCLIDNQFAYMYINRRFDVKTNKEDWYLAGYRLIEDGYLSSTMSPLTYGLKMNMIHQAVDKKGNSITIKKDLLTLKTENKVEYRSIGYKLYSQHYFSRLYMQDIFGIYHYTNYAEYDIYSKYIKS